MNDMPRVTTTEIAPTADEKFAKLYVDIADVKNTISEIITVMEKMTEVLDNLAATDQLQHLRLNMAENKDSASRVLD